MSTPDTRFTLRQLPLPAKAVVTVFLFAVGLGYVSAMVQLHDKHSSKNGEPLPSPADVVEIFSGLKVPDPSAPPPCGRIDTLLSGDSKASDVSKDNMAPAFFAKSKGWAAARDPRGGVAVEAQRDGELLAMLAWVRVADPAAKKAAYETDAFPLPDGLKGQPITPEFLTAGKELKVKSLVNARCQNCHKEQPPELGSFAALEPLVTPPSQELIDGKWVRSARQTSKEKLIQSTHAHLLTFAILFALTGIIFAFTSYPGILRLTLAPVVLLAQVADVSCWWLARIPAPYGPLFAQAIMGTGAVVGLGLILQIVLSLLNMCGPKGKVLMVLLMVVVGGGLGYVGLKVIQPALDEEKAAASAKVPPELVKKPEPAKPPGVDPKPPVETKKEPQPPVEPKKEPQPPVEPKKEPQPPAPVVSHLEKLIMGPRTGAPWNAKGSMAAAFFDKDDGTYKAAIKDDPTAKPKLDAEREGERLALQAWLQSDPAVRKKAYDEKKFALPAALVGKPLTKDYALDGGKAANVTAILTDRCARCHAKDAEQPDYPLEKYDELMKYIEKK